MSFFNEIMKISFLKSFIINSKYVENKTSGKVALLIYKKTICDFDKSSKIQINKGRLTLNRTFNKKNPFTTLITLRKNSKIIVNGKFNFYQGSIISLGGNAVLELGDGSYMNGQCKLICHDKITIGDGTLISDNVTIRDSDMHKIIGKEDEISKPIHIGNHVWIGDGARILKGVTIGDGAIVAAGAVVTKDVSAKTLVGGVPTKVLRENVEWEG